MSLTESKLAYSDCYEVLNKAVADPKGARVPVKDYGSGVYLRMRMHQARKIDRIENRKTYAPDHPMHGLSEYDKLVIRLYDVDGRWYIYLERPDALEHTVEPLSEVAGYLEDTTDGEFEEIKVAEPIEAPELLTAIPDLRRRL